MARPPRAPIVTRARDNHWRRRGRSSRHGPPQASAGRDRRTGGGVPLLRRDRRASPRTVAALGLAVPRLSRGGHEEGELAPRGQLLHLRDSRFSDKARSERSSERVPHPTAVDRIVLEQLGPLSFHGNHQRRMSPSSPDIPIAAFSRFVDFRSPRWEPHSDISLERRASRWRGIAPALADRGGEQDLFAFGEKILTLLDEANVSTKAIRRRWTPRCWQRRSSPFRFPSPVRSRLRHHHARSSLRGQQAAQRRLRERRILLPASRFDDPRAAKRTPEADGSVPPLAQRGKVPRLIPDLVLRVAKGLAQIRDQRLFEALKLNS